jgi:hypothetical protein
MGARRSWQQLVADLLLSPRARRSMVLEPGNRRVFTSCRCPGRDSNPVGEGPQGTLSSGSVANSRVLLFPIVSSDTRVARGATTSRVLLIPPPVSTRRQAPDKTSGSFRLRPIALVRADRREAQLACRPAGCERIQTTGALCRRFDGGRQRDRVAGSLGLDTPDPADADSGFEAEPLLGCRWPRLVVPHASTADGSPINM